MQEIIGVSDQVSVRCHGALLCLVLLIAIFTQAAAQDKYIIGYYPSWAVYARNYHVPNIDAAKLTHLNYAFANIVNGEVVLGDVYADTDRFYPGDCWDAGCERGSFHQLEILKQQHPQLKTLISVGGWTWSSQFSDAAWSSQSRNRFATSCATFIDRWEFDGVDIDWEYPVSGGENPGRPEDRHNFTLLMRAIRSQLDSMEAANGRDYLLTAAMSASPNTMPNYELDSLVTVLDWFNLMTYDFNGAWSAVANHNAPLFANPADPTPPPNGPHLNCHAGVTAYLNAGVPAQQICLGLPFYGHGFGGIANNNHGLFQPFSGVLPNGTWQAGWFDYWDVAAHYENVNGYTRYWDDAAQVPWVYNPMTQVMISYDDSLAVAHKGNYVLENNLRGAMFWELSADHNHELLAALYRELACLADPFDLTVTRSDDGMILRFASSAARTYRIYATTNRDNDGNPDGGADLQWLLLATVTGAAGSTLWSDTAAYSAYKVYAVTEVCN